MTNKFNRREILKTTLGTALVAMIPGQASAEVLKYADLAINDDIHVSLSKHGNVKEDKYLLWSVMTVQNPKEFASKIDAILKRNNYRSEITYHSNDKFKLASCKEIIDLVMTDGGVSFEMKFFESSPASFKDLKPTDYEAKMTSIFKKSIPKKKVSKLISKSEDNHGPSSQYNKKFLALHGLHNIAVDPIEDRILQVNNLCAGICYALMTKREVKASVKVELNKYLNSKAPISQTSNGVRRNIAPFNISREKI